MTASYMNGEINVQWIASVIQLNTAVRNSFRARLLLRKTTVAKIFIKFSRF